MHTCARRAPLRSAASAPSVGRASGAAKARRPDKRYSHDLKKRFSIGTDVLERVVKERRSGPQFMAIHHR